MWDYWKRSSLSGLVSSPASVLYFYLLYWKSIVDYKEGWTLKNCFQTVTLEKILESPLNSKETKLVNPKGNKSWILIGRIVAEAEASILWPPDMKSPLTGQDAGKDQRQKEKGVTEDKIVGWPHWYNAYKFEQTPVDSKGQGSLVCCTELQSWMQLSNWTTQQREYIQKSIKWSRTV